MECVWKNERMVREEKRKSKERGGAGGRWIR
jgi:hypothetical protein